MRVGIVGGRLQGVEASYLALKAGWEVILLDKNPEVPAIGLSDIFYQLDVTNENSTLIKILESVDLIIPATEDSVALECLKEKANIYNLPVAFDSSAYSISSSKSKSNLLFNALGIPEPKYWPECDFPLIIKPSCSSGSKGIRVLNSLQELQSCEEYKNSILNDVIIQEFLDGSSYSVEVFGFDEDYLPLQTTKIEVDGKYDCKRVLAPSGLSQNKDVEFKELGIKIAKAIKLVGIMDVEVILHNNTLKVLEIDARLPSQTPTAVFNSTGINFLKILYEIFYNKIMPIIPTINCERAVIYEHIKVNSDTLEVLGENIISDAGPLKLYRDFFGADEALTDLSPGSSQWAATLIIKGENQKEVWKSHKEVIKNIKKYFQLTKCFA